MTVRLTIEHDTWSRHVRDMAHSVDGLVPVVKGNGYGFGRDVLHPIAATIANDVCVGTVHELDHISPGITPVVLTPTLVAPHDARPVLTVGSTVHVDALRDWRGRVLVKLESSMHRYGIAATEFRPLCDHAARIGLDVVGASIHLSLAGDHTTRVDEVERWLDHLDPALPLWLSHLDAESFGRLQQRHPSRTFRLRLGTALWHGDKAFLQLTADVIDAHPISAGTLAGYRHVTVPTDGHVVIVGGGSANGIAALSSGASPFHFARQRLALLELPHMHSSMCFVPTGSPLPAPGDRVDVQRPLIATTVDHIEWKR